MIRTYTEIAAEYYDRNLHPTCANFRQASRQLVERWFPRHPGDKVVCEVGAGRSLVAEASRPRPHKLVLVDSSRPMLAHSKEWFGSECWPVVGDAESIPLVVASAGVVVSVLGDPYNVPPFWREVRRIMSNHSIVIFTTPSYEWARSFRDGLNSAEFALRDGTTIQVPSFVYSVEEQTAMMRSAGLRVKEVRSTRIRDLPEKGRSWKLMHERGLEGTVVTGFLAVRDSASR